MEVRAFDYEVDKPIRIISKPNECPYCFKTIEPWIYKGNLFTRDPNVDGATSHMDLVFRCTARECRRLFIAHYVASVDPEYFLYQEILAPNTKPVQNFPSTINEISSGFIEIYTQAHHAEEKGLNQICGLGYRKALEFLIKDFIIYTDKDKAELIKKMTLANCIGQLPLEANIVDLAKRGAWLGNDETHYVRVWQDKDINDLKNIIEILASKINSKILVDKYLKEMPDPKNSK